MKVTKRRKYPEIMDSVGIHTLSGFVPEEITEIESAVQGTVKSCSRKKERGKDSYRTYLQLNPNKIEGKQQIVTRFSNFQEILSLILNGCGSDLERFTYNRADLCFDSSFESAFEDYKKLHRLLICCVSDAYIVKNCYHTEHLWELQDLSLAIKNDRFEMENYDKQVESSGSSESRNRLELRAKRINQQSLQHEFELWCTRLDKAAKHYENVQHRYNDVLERLYKQDRSKPKKYRVYRTLTDFLLRYQECIFCRSQLVDLLSRFDEVKNPESRADNFKKKHHIEYFSERDLKFIVNVIKRKIRQYFRS